MAILPPNETLGLIGGGNMAQSILFPLFDKGLIDPKCVLVSAKTTATLDIWKKRGCRISHKNEEVWENSNIIIWAVKPQIFPLAIEELSKCLNGNNLREDALHMSVMAGISLEQFTLQLKQTLTKTRSQDHNHSVKAVRIMPNIGLQVSCGVAVFACNCDIKDSDKVLVQNMFKPIGLCYEVQEQQINAFCGLFGSGIGFMFPIMEALSDGAVKMGIPRPMSLEIAAQVMKGAGELYLQNRIHPGALKDMVCSPGGTTIAGISELERGGIRSTIINAIEAATTRGQELGRLAATIPIQSKTNL